MSSNNYFQGSIFNVSPLCQDCELIMFAHQNGIMFHECEVCKNKYQEMLAHKDTTCGDNRFELIAKYKQHQGDKNDKRKQCYLQGWKEGPVRRC